MNLKNWTIKSIITGLITGLVSLFFVPDYRFSIFVFIIVTLVMIIYNPKKRFMKAFWVVFSALIGLNKISLWLVGKLFDINFVFSFTTIDWIVSVALILLCAILLLLDFLERSDRKWNLFGFINISTSNIQGNNTNISEGANVTYIQVEGDYVISDGQKQNLNDFNEVKALLQREEELNIILQSKMLDEQTKLNYKNELKSVRDDTALIKEEIVNLSNTVNLISEKYPNEASKVSELLMSGFYGSAKDYFFHIQQEKQDRKLAENIGISYKELIELEYEIEQGHTSKDGMIYYYNIWFDEDSPEEIVSRIPRIEKIDGKYCLEVSPFIFDEPDEHEYENENENEEKYNVDSYFDIGPE